MLEKHFNTSPPRPIMLSDAAEKYPIPGLTAEQKEQGSYFPDAVIDPFIKAGNTAAIVSPQVRDKPDPPAMFTPQQVREIIQAALNEFDPQLGAKAEKIFNAGYDKAAAVMTTDPVDSTTVEKSETPGQWRFQKSDPVVILPGHTMIQRTMAAHETAPTNGDPANPNPYAVIDFQFDGTVTSLIYIAHELGHAIADGNLQGNRKYKANDNPIHMREMQAYFVQDILYDYVKKHSEELNKQYPGIAEWTAYDQTFNLKKYTANLSSGFENQDLHFRLMGLLNAQGIFNIARKNPAMRKKIINAILCGDGPKNIVQALSIAGIKNKEDMQRMACGVINQIRPEQKPVASSRPSQGKV